MDSVTSTDRPKDTNSDIHKHSKLPHPTLQVFVCFCLLAFVCLTSSANSLRKWSEVVAHLPFQSV